MMIMGIFSYGCFDKMVTLVSDRRNLWSFGMWLCNRIFMIDIFVYYMDVVPLKDLFWWIWMVCEWVIWGFCILVRMDRYGGLGLLH